MSFYHDPEVPAGFQDADIEQAQLEAEGRRLARLHARGICTHGWTLGHGNVNRDRLEIDEDRLRGRFPERATDVAIQCQDDIPAGHVLCLDCGTVIVDRFAVRR